MRLLVLANSKKFNGRCIAGIDLDSGNWIRPVSKTEHGEFSGAECSVTVGGSRRQVQSLDVIEVVVGSSKPGIGHPEDIQTNHGNWKHLTSSLTNILTIVMICCSTASPLSLKQMHKLAR